MRPPGSADTAHFLEHDNRVGYDADDVGGVHHVERFVWKVEARSVHLPQPHIAAIMRFQMAGRLAQHGL